MTPILPHPFSHTHSPTTRPENPFVNQYVGVFWPKEKSWYYGKVLAYNATDKKCWIEAAGAGLKNQLAALRSGFYLVLYDDGEIWNEVLALERNVNSGQSPRSLPGRKSESDYKWKLVHRNAEVANANNEFLYHDADEAYAKLLESDTGGVCRPQSPTTPPQPFCHPPFLLFPGREWGGE